MYVHIYQGSVVAGNTSGTLVSEGDSESAPISIILNASNNEISSPIKLAIRCDAGYNTTGNTTIQPVGTSASSWDLAPDNTGSAGTWVGYGEALTISSVIGTVNTIFWAKAKAISSETPINDSSVNLVVNSVITAI